MPSLGGHLLSNELPINVCHLHAAPSYRFCTGHEWVTTRAGRLSRETISTINTAVFPSLHLIDRNPNSNGLQGCESTQTSGVAY